MIGNRFLYIRNASVDDGSMAGDERQRIGATKTKLIEESTLIYVGTDVFSSGTVVEQVYVLVGMSSEALKSHRDVFLILKMGKKVRFLCKIHR